MHPLHCLSLPYSPKRNTHTGGIVLIKYKGVKSYSGAKTLPLQGQYTFWIFFSQKLKKMLKSFSSPGRKCPTLPRLELVTQKSPEGDLLLTKLQGLDEFRTANWTKIKSELQFSGVLGLFPTLSFQN